MTKTAALHERRLVARTSLSLEGVNKINNAALARLKKIVPIFNAVRNLVALEY